VKRLRQSFNDVKSEWFSSLQWRSVSKCSKKLTYRTKPDLSNLRGLAAFAYLTGRSNWTIPLSLQYVEERVLVISKRLRPLKGHNSWLHFETVRCTTIMKNVMESMGDKERRGNIRSQEYGLSASSIGSKFDLRLGPPEPGPPPFEPWK